MEVKMMNKEDQDAMLIFPTVELATWQKDPEALNNARLYSIAHYLNQEYHVQSLHDRLRTWVGKNEWFNWQGIISDISLPSNNLTEGKVLIDKFSSDEVQGESEFLDYHVWLKISQIKYMVTDQMQELAVGDVIKATSKITSYVDSQGNYKFGLGATILRGAGIFVKDPQTNLLTLEGNYARHGDWIAKLQNPALPKQLKERYLTSLDLNVFKNFTQSVVASYRFNRHRRYFERLTAVDDSNKQAFSGIFRGLNMTSNGQNMIPQIRLDEIISDNHQVVVPKAWFNYTYEWWKLGELAIGDKIAFKAKVIWHDPKRYRASSHASLHSVSQVELLSQHDYVPLPNDQDTILGYILHFNHQDKHPRLQSLKYQEWRKENNLPAINFTIKEDGQMKASNNQYSVKQLAQQAGISTNQVYYIVNMVLKLKPTFVDQKGEKYYDEHALAKIIQSMGKDGYGVSSLPKKDDHGLLDVNEIAEVAKLSKNKVKLFMRQHKEIKPDLIDTKNHNKKFYAQSVVQYVLDHWDEQGAPKQETEKDPNLEHVEAEKAAPVSQVAAEPEKITPKPAAEPALAKDELDLMKTVADIIHEDDRKPDESTDAAEVEAETKEPEEAVSSIKFVKKAEPVQVKSADFVIKKKSAKKTPEVTETEKTRVKLLTSYGLYYAEQFASLAQAAQTVMQLSADSASKHFLPVTKADGSQAYISCDIIEAIE